MKPNEAARRVGIHVNTVRTWTMKDFRRFFSPGAQGGDGHNRDITDADLRVLTYINRLKAEGRVADEIVAALIEAERRGFESLPLPHVDEHVVPMAVVSRDAAETAVGAERKIMAEHIRWLEARVDELKTELAEERSESSSKIDSLTRKLIEAETELRMWREGWRPPTEKGDREGQ